MKKKIFITIIGIVILISSCTDQNKNEVVVYTSVDQVFSEPVLKAFEKQTGIKVNAVFDTEETKSTSVLNRLISEKNNPQCDVFWSGDPMRADVLKQKEITEAYRSPASSGINAAFIDKDYHWIGFSARARVLLVNTNLVKPQDIPTSILDLSNEKHKGKFTIANPLFGTTSFHMAALFATLGDEKAKQFMEDLKKNEVIIASSNGDVKKKVATGEIPMGLTDTDDANEAVKEGAPVKAIFLDQRGFGNLIVPNTASLIKNSPNNENGKKLIDFLLSVETEKMLAESCAQMPLHKGVAVPNTVPSLDNIVPMKVDYARVAQKSEQIKQYLKQWAAQ
ncbi:iron(III) transport system substrate-binding protein [Pedobacter sp. CG_S7]|uniref:extracellular solute-binding protein n=1 Tax=Pedobacter sp. CG_S7 TaxID=3143930 RepID=UPI003392C6DB